MEITKFTPNRNLWKLNSHINGMFDNFFTTALRKDLEGGIMNQTPAVDVYEKDNTYVVKAEIPGIDKKNIHVDVKDNTLILSGERFGDKEVKKENYYRRELSHGAFKRLFTLSDGLDADGIKADYKDGILKVVIPKLEIKEPKRITIQ